MRAVVLSGGGARGAYEAGVLRYLIEELPRRVGHRIEIDLVCGTSVGAIHSCYLAATAHQGPGRADRLAEIWRRFRLDETLPFSARDMIRIPRRLLGMRREGVDPGEDRWPDRLPGLLDTAPLERTVLNAIPWRWIRRNIREGRMRAACVAATEIASGRTVVFVEQAVGDRVSWRPEVNLESRAARLTPLHALASAAIPILFPAVRLGRAYFADGGLRLNTPLVPAIRLGADRVLIVGLRQTPGSEPDSENARHRIQSYGNPVYMFGKVLNALLLDHLETDLVRMRVMNELLHDGLRAFGPEFVERLNAASRDRNQPLRLIQDVLIRPSSDLGQVAADVLAAKEGRVRLPPLLGYFLRQSGASGRFEADLLSYVLFDGEYAEPLIELGYRDAQLREEQLVRFFSDDPQSIPAAADAG